MAKAKDPLKPELDEDGNPIVPAPAPAPEVPAPAMGGSQLVPTDTDKATQFLQKTDATSPLPSSAQIASDNSMGTGAALGAGALALGGGLQLVPKTPAADLAIKGAKAITPYVHNIRYLPKVVPPSVLGGLGPIAMAGQMAAEAYTNSRMEGGWDQAAADQRMVQENAQEKGYAGVPERTWSVLSRPLTTAYGVGQDITRGLVNSLGSDGSAGPITPEELKAAKAENAAYKASKASKVSDKAPYISDEERATAEQDLMNQADVVSEPTPISRSASDVARPKSAGDEKGALEDKVAVQTPYGMLYMPKSQAGRAQKMQDEITASPYSLGGAVLDNDSNRVGYTDKEYASGLETARAREMARIQRETQPRASEADKFAVAAEGEQRRNERYAGLNPRNELPEWFKERQAERPNMSAPGTGAGSDVQREVARMRKQEIYAEGRYKARHSGSTKGAPARSTDAQLYGDATNKLANAQLQKGDAQDAKFTERERQQADRQLIEEYNARASEDSEFKKAFPNKEAFAAAQRFFGRDKNKKDTSRPNVPSFTEVRRPGTVINS